MEEEGRRGREVEGVNKGVRREERKGRKKTK